MSYFSLLPSGCYDVLPPKASAEAKLTSSLLEVFENFGYELVAPPLLEYTDNLLLGRGADLSPHILRVMDPETNRVMGLRADMTLQIGRIAKTRLRASPRPIRLSYAGSVLRLQSKSLEANRQLSQVGLELIGADLYAEIEVIIIAIKALSNSGIKEITVDLHLPQLVSCLIDESLDEKLKTSAFDAIAEKDVANLIALGVENTEIIDELIAASGEAEKVLAQIRKINLPPKAIFMVDELEKVAMKLKQSAPDTNITIDITERRGFDYYSGISFSFFAKGASQEIGRGGRYEIGDEKAVGCSFFAERLRELLPEAPCKKTATAKYGDEKEIKRLLDEGYTVILGE